MEGKEAWRRERKEGKEHVKSKWLESALYSMRQFSKISLWQYKFRRVGMDNRGRGWRDLEGA